MDKIEFVKESMDSIAMSFETAVSTKNSALRIYDLDADWAAYLPTLCEEIDPLLDHSKLYGKAARQNRSVSFFSDTSVGYRYSGSLARSKPLTNSLREFLAVINTSFRAEFNGILVNKYDGGGESIGKHSDDEGTLDPCAGVVLVSVGAVRTFRIRCSITGAIVANVPTEPGKIIQMWGDFQKEFTHEIPVEKRVKGVRYSLTFRKHVV